MLFEELKNFNILSDNVDSSFKFEKNSEICSKKQNDFDKDKKNIKKIKFIY